MKRMERVFLVSVAVSAVLVAFGFATSRHEEPSPTRPESRPEPITPAPAPEPVSKECGTMVETLQKHGAVRPGDISREGAVLLVDQRWARMDFDLQEGSAICLSHYLAGGQDRWIRQITFKNQMTGIVYGTIEGKRYRTGP